MAYTNELTETFLQYYNKLDRHIRQVLSEKDGVSHTMLIKKMSGEAAFRLYKNIFMMGARLRNSIIHDTLDCEPIAIISDVFAQQYISAVSDIIEPKYVLDMIGERGHFYPNENTKILDIITSMKTNHFHYVPILKDNKVIDVFSESTLLNFFALTHSLQMGRNTTISEIMRIMTLENYFTEKFVFVAKDTNVFEIKQLFEKRKKEDKNVGIIFITQNGDISEDLLGYVTIFDVINYKYKKR